MTKAEKYKQDLENKLNISNFENNAINMRIFEEMAKSDSKLNCEFSIIVRCFVGLIEIDLLFDDNTELKISKTTESISYKL